MKPLPDGATLDGTISSSFYAALGPAGGTVSGGVSGSSETVFRPDGTYGSTSSSAAVAAADGRVGACVAWWYLSEGFVGRAGAGWGSDYRKFARGAWACQWIET